MEARADHGQAVRRVLEGVDGPDAVELLGRRDQESVVRADQHVPPAGRDRHRQPIRAHPRIDHRDVEPDRQVRQGTPQQEGAVADRELPDLVADVDDARVGSDAEDDAAHDRRARVAQAEVGQEGDQGTAHGPGSYGRYLEAAPGGG